MAYTSQWFPIFSDIVISSFLVKEAFGEFVSDWSAERFVERCAIYNFWMTHSEVIRV